MRYLNGFRERNNIPRLAAFLLLLASGPVQAAVVDDHGQFEILARVDCDTGAFLDDYLLHPGSPAFNISAGVDDEDFCSGGANASASADVTISPGTYALDLAVSGATNGNAFTSAYATQYALDPVLITLTESATINVAGTVDIELFRGTGTGEADAGGYFYFRIYDNDNFYESASAEPLNTGTWNWTINEQFRLPPGNYKVEGGISTFSTPPDSTHSGALNLAITIAAATPVTIDVLPGDETNLIDHTADVQIPVAVITEGGFDATQVDPLEVYFGAWQAESVGVPDVTDAGGDPALDILFDFELQETGINCGDTSVTLEGETYAGEAIIGVDTIETEACTSVCHP